MDKLVIYAPNVGGGGGLILLRDLLNAAWPVPRLTAILDRRGLPHLGKLPARIEAHWVTSSLRGRWRAEKLLSRLVGPRDLVLCFHNLPPVLPTYAHVFCYVQNANLVGIIPTSDLSGWLRTRYTIERFIARRFRHRVYRYIVQTPTMAAALRQWYGADVPPIDVLPFIDADYLHAMNSPPRAAPTATEWERSAAKWDFIYVSDGSFHKNHSRLFAAWQLLSEQGAHPSLAVTLHPERDRALRECVRQLAAEGLQIVDLGQIPHAEVLAAYRHSRALIYPSYAESFGIPLIEAQKVGLPVIAPELDYVRDVCKPEVTFDAFSPRSIARAVLRFLGRPSDQVMPLSADRFAAALLDLHTGNS